MIAAFNVDTMVVSASLSVDAGTITELVSIVDWEGVVDSAASDVVSDGTVVVGSLVDAYTETIVVISTTVLSNIDVVVEVSDGWLVSIAATVDSTAVVSVVVVDSEPIVVTSGIPVVSSAKVDAISDDNRVGTCVTKFDVIVEVDGVVLVDVSCDTTIGAVVCDATVGAGGNFVPIYLGYNERNVPLISHGLIYYSY